MPPHSITTSFNLHGELAETAANQGDDIEDQEGDAPIEEVVRGSILTVSGVSAMTNVPVTASIST